MARVNERKPNYPVTIHFSEEEYKMLIDKKKKNGSSISRTVRQCLVMANKPSSKAYNKTDKGTVEIFIEVTEETKEKLQDIANAEELTLTEFLEETISEIAKDLHEGFNKKVDDSSPGKNSPDKNSPGKNNPGKNNPGKNSPGENSPGENLIAEKQESEANKNKEYEDLLETAILFEEEEKNRESEKRESKKKEIEKRESEKRESEKKKEEKEKLVGTVFDDIVTYDEEENEEE